MPLKTVVTIALSLTTSLAYAQASYPKMAPIAEYQIPDRNAEIALARSAAPASIAEGAEVRVFGGKGYETAVQGKNGFVCLVERSWAKDTTDSEFWNPKLRSPNCFNDAAAREYLPIYVKKTEWVLAGLSRDEIATKLKAAFDRSEFTAPTPTAMAYMLSKDQYLNDSARHWHPHIMFYAPISDPALWTANQDDAPVSPVSSQEQHLTIINVPVAHWSDNSPDAGHH